MVVDLYKPIRIYSKFEGCFHLQALLCSIKLTEQCSSNLSLVFECYFVSFVFFTIW